MNQELQDKLKTYRLSEEEYGKACDLLHRPLQGIEWAIFSALWSEHCSYKSSKFHLKKLYSQSERVLQSFGENAGIVDLGEGEKVAFKMESHNHPSFIEPYQGAATGVGGILRDIFTMGARPVALANYLCFGEPTAERMPAIVDGVVRGIGGYGNCVGVPTITGQTNFDKSYNENVLVNALAVGLFGSDDPICLSEAKGPGNYVVYVGAKTGRDGIHGASMASESFGEDSESKRPTIQIGDPFYEKLLIEACLEVMKADLVVSIQDMGAAGITSSCFEMSEKGKVGLKLNLDQVPLRDHSLTAEDILLSESQERMLLICLPEKFEALAKVFKRWGLDATVIGTVTEEPEVEISWKGEVVGKIDPAIVVSNAPYYDRPHDQWTPRFDKEKALPKASSAGIEKTFSKVEAADRSWIYEQYDQRVGASTAYDCSETIGVVKLPETNRALGLVLGCRPYVMRQDAFWGGRDSVIYPALELAAKGFEPLAVTDCLNFGNPEKKETMTDFVAALKGMNEVCETLNTPIISGNVSFYNETYSKNITPTPSTGIVGLRDDLSFMPTSYFDTEGANVWLLRFDKGWLTGQQSESEGVEGYLPNEVQGLKEFAASLRNFCNDPLVTSTRLVNRFGLGATLARMTMSGNGADIKFEGSLVDAMFYGVIVVTPAGDLGQVSDSFSEYFDSNNTNFEHIGTTGGSEFKINDEKWTTDDLKVQYKKSWRTNFETLA